MTRPHLFATGALAAAAVLLTAQPALAAPRLSFAGLGTATATASGHSYSGSLSGSPISGAFSGSLAAADGSLPGLGECEPGTATLRVEDDNGKYVELASSSGQICALFLPLGTMHQVTGRWSVSSTNIKKLAKTSGVLDIRILNGQSDVYATAG
jgi:hypothetical protein